MEFWNPDHFDFADALNEEIWSRSPELQQEVQPIAELKLPGATGAQQAMLESSLLGARGPLPWVPDLVGKEAQIKAGVIIVGSAYAGFINEYSTRPNTMPLKHYLDAASVQEFQRLFLKHVVLDDPNYYTPISNLCSDLGSASRLLLMDLCRVSLVKRDTGDSKRRDKNHNFKKEPLLVERYAESKEPAEWLWKRFVEGQARCILALGLTVEHGLLRLFNHRGMAITQNGTPFIPKPFEQGAWVNEYANTDRQLGYWLNHKTWWTVRGRVNEVERVWHVLPVYHPRRHKNTILPMSVPRPY